MKELPKKEDKVAYICQALRRETLEPAQQEAREIIAEAEQQRERILQEADRQRKERHKEMQNQMAQEQSLFRLSLEHAGKQAISLIKQEIEESLFSPAIGSLIDKAASKPETVAAFLNSVIHAVVKEGIGANIEAILPKTVSPQSIMPLLEAQIRERLQKEGAIRVGSFAGGAQIRLKDKNMVLDFSDKALEQLLSRFLRESFHEYLFSKE